VARQLIPYGLSLILLQSENVAWLNVEEFTLFCISFLTVQKGLLHRMVTYSIQQSRDNNAVIFKFNIYDINCIYSVVRCMKHAEPFNDAVV